MFSALQAMWPVQLSSSASRAEAATDNMEMSEQGDLTSGLQVPSLVGRDTFFSFLIPMV